MVWQGSAAKAGVDRVRRMARVGAIRMGFPAGLDWGEDSRLWGAGGKRKLTELARGERVERDILVEI